jgi:capsular exopolysaccharide synthesis family protein
MSRIFDALQRSEAERSGVEIPTAPAIATELLEAAERHASGAGMAHADDFSADAIGDAAGNLDAPAFEQFRALEVRVSPASRLVCLTDKESLAAEKFRFLGVRLRQMQQRRQLKKVLITSTIPQEGKSMVAANLACTLARRQQQRILLVDGDLRRPTLSRLFGLGKLAGLSEWLQGEPGQAANIYRLEGAGIWFLPPGSAPQNPLESMQSGRLAAIMDQLAAWFDWVIVDSPPVLPLADTSVWTRMVDGILLVTRQGTTDRRQLQRGMEAIEQAKLLGMVLNGSINTAHSDYYQHYGAAVAKAKKEVNGVRQQ